MPFRKSGRFLCGDGPSEVMSASSSFLGVGLAGWWRQNPEDMYATDCGPSSVSAGWRLRAGPRHWLSLPGPERPLRSLGQRQRIRLDRESEANHDLNRLLDKPGSG